MTFLTYVAIIKSNSQLHVEKVIVPDLEIVMDIKNKETHKIISDTQHPNESFVELEDQEDVTLVEITQQNVNQKIAEILDKTKELPIPTSVENLRKRFPKDTNFLNVETTLELKDGPFALTFPKLGVGLSLTASIVSGIIQIVAVSLIAENQKDAGIGIGITMSLLFVLVNTVVYLYSNTRNDLRELGSHADSLLKCNAVLFKDKKPKRELTLMNKFLAYAPYVLFSGIALVATAIDTGTRYKEAEVLADRANEAGNTLFTRDTIILAAIIQAISNGISEFTVFNSFMRQAAKDVSGKLVRQNQQDEDSLTSDTEKTMLIS